MNYACQSHLTQKGTIGRVPDTSVTESSLVVILVDNKYIIFRYNILWKKNRISYSDSTVIKNDNAYEQISDYANAMSFFLQILLIMIIM